MKFDFNKQYKAFCKARKARYKLAKKNRKSGIPDHWNDMEDDIKKMLEEQEFNKQLNNAVKNG